jgi:hypothetical protein
MGKRAQRNTRASLGWRRKSEKEEKRKKIFQYLLAAHTLPHATVEMRLFSLSRSPEFIHKCALWQQQQQRL